MPGREMRRSRKGRPLHRPLVGVVVVHYGPLSVTFRCLKSLDRLDYGPLRVILVDNTGQESRYSAYLGRFRRRISVVPMHGNAGFAAAVNRGMAKAAAGGAEYAWLVNNDAVVSRGALTALVRTMERMPQAGVAGSRITDDGVPPRIWHAGGRIDLKTGQTHHIGSGMRDCGQFDRLREMDYVTGCSMLIRARMIREVGMLDENFVMYYEETDLCIRARKAGWKVVYVPGSRVCHCISGREDRGDWGWLYYETRNRLLLLLKHNSRMLPMALVMILKWPLGSCILRGRFGGAWNTVKGLLSFVGIALGGGR